MIKNNGTKKLTKFPAPLRVRAFVFFRRVLVGVVVFLVAVVFRFAIVFLIARRGDYYIASCAFSPRLCVSASPRRKISSISSERRVTVPAPSVITRSSSCKS